MHDLTDQVRDYEHHDQPLNNALSRDVMLCSSSSSRNAPRTPKSLSIWSIHQLRDVLISESRMSRTRKQLMQSVVFHPRPCVWTPALLRIQSGMLMVLGSDLRQSSAWRWSLKHHDKQSDVKDLSQTGRKTTWTVFILINTICHF